MVPEPLLESRPPEPSSRTVLAAPASEVPIFHLKPCTVNQTAAPTDLRRARRVPGQTLFQPPECERGTG